LGVIGFGLFKIGTSLDVVHPKSFQHIRSSELNEVSGIVYSTLGSAYMVNDSGNPEDVFMLRANEQSLRRISVMNSKNRDWEALCQTDSTLLIADIGDNQRKRTRVRVFAIPLDSLNIKTRVNAVRYRIQYPNGPRNAEAFFADPLTGDWFVMTKTAFSAELYRIDHPQSLNAVINAILSETRVSARYITSADISRDGMRLIVKSLFGVRIWNRRPGEDVPTMLNRNPDSARWVLNPFSEAVAIHLDDKGFSLISEGFRWFSSLSKISNYPIR
jgi:hypothetical protein